MTLELAGVTVRYGPTTAVNDVSLIVPAGRITGLIGPNGAGKTSTFNACSGLVEPDRGHVYLDGVEMTTMRVHRRCQLGLGRTFQSLELFESLSVRENVSLGGEALRAGGVPWRHVWAGRRERAELAAATAEAIEVCGLTTLADSPVAGLSTGQRRLVDLARAVAGHAHVLLLDEPSSGLDPDETARLGGVLEILVAERNLGILLVEHDMGLVMTVCAHIHVLEFGGLIFAGSPAEVQASSIVQRAYLGSAA